jgi:O-antigen ligase
MWVALSILILSLLLISATRSTLLLSFAPLAIVFVVKGNVVRRLLRLGLFSGIAVLMVSILVSYLANFAGVDTAKMADRLQSIVQVFDDPWSDPSFIERASQTETAWRVFVSNLSFGAGPGYLYDWSTVSGGYRGTFAAVDSPLLFPAKFGLVGIILLVVIVLVFIVFLRGLIHHIGPTVPCTALVGYTTIVGAQMMIGSPFHDKGVSFGLLFLLALSLYEKEGREH